VPNEILRRLKRDRTAWRNFQRFPASYQRIRIGWIVAARRRRDVFEQRLGYFLKMTARNKRSGRVQKGRAPLRPGPDLPLRRSDPPPAREGAGPRAAPPPRRAGGPRTPPRRTL